MASNGTNGNDNQLLVVDYTGGVTLIDPSTPLKRLNYFDGKFLRASDFDVEAGLPPPIGCPFKPGARIRCGLWIRHHAQQRRHDPDRSRSRYRPVRQGAFDAGDGDAEHTGADRCVEEARAVGSGCQRQDRGSERSAIV
jgi:hypothetical protein